MLEGAKQRLEGQLHREGEASTVKMRFLGMLEVRRGNSSTSRKMSGLVILFTVPKAPTQDTYQSTSTKDFCE